MSIGPEPKAQDPNISVTAQASHLAKKTLSAFFETPARYTWYLAVIATFIGLYIGKSFSLQYWILFAFIGGFNAFIYFSERRYENITKD